MQPPRLQCFRVRAAIGANAGPEQARASGREGCADAASNRTTRMWRVHAEATRLEPLAEGAMSFCLRVLSLRPPWWRRRPEGETLRVCAASVAYERHTSRASPGDTSSDAAGAVRVVGRSGRCARLRAQRVLCASLAPLRAFSGSRCRDAGSPVWRARTPARDDRELSGAQFRAVLRGLGGCGSRLSAVGRRRVAWRGGCWGGGEGGGLREG